MKEGFPEAVVEENNGLETPSPEVINALKDEFSAQLEVIKTKIENATSKEELMALVADCEPELDDMAKKLEPFEEWINQTSNERWGYDVNSSGIEKTIESITALQTSGKLEGEYGSLLDSLTKIKKIIDTHDTIVEIIRSLDSERRRTRLNLHKKLEELINK